MTHSLYHAKLRKPAELRIHCDEAGRGPLAGPVTVGCTLAIWKPELSDYKDSKQLTPTQREYLYAQIKNQSCTDALPASPYNTSSISHFLFSSTGRASAQEIDQYWIIQAIQLACLRGIGKLLQTHYTFILREQLLHSDFWEDILAVTLLDQLFNTDISEQTPLIYQTIPNSYAHLVGLIRDGNHTFGLDQTLKLPLVTIIKGDQKNPLISAASIVAKVERDVYMTQKAEEFPVYHFEKHKWYGSKLHRESIATHGLSPLHRSSYCRKAASHAAIFNQLHNPNPPVIASPDWCWINSTKPSSPVASRQILVDHKPSLLLHICCAPDLSRPLHWLKQHFKLYLFRYNPNIHPRKEHEQRYAQFLKLVWLEPGDYEILEDWYDPKEFFQAMIDQKTSIDPNLKNADGKQVLQQAGNMEERSDRCNPCYSSRLLTAAKMAAEHHIPYFTSTLLISPKKIAEKLYQRGKDASEHYPTTKFLWFDFAKNGGYNKANELTRMHGLRRQNYCGCGRTIPKPGEKKEWYHGG